LFNETINILNSKSPHVFRGLSSALNAVSDLSEHALEQSRDALLVVQYDPIQELAIIAGRDPPGMRDQVQDRFTRDSTVSVSAVRTTGAQRGDHSVNRRKLLPVDRRAILEGDIGVANGIRRANGYAVPAQAAYFRVGHNGAVLFHLKDIPGITDIRACPALCTRIQVYRDFDHEHLHPLWRKYTGMFMLAQTTSYYRTNCHFGSALSLATGR
jgi:hypothetical protein